ncbi:MAG: hypothetical protein KGH71_05105 [Candidatus Micrarchaeota archaeon]|nr:hypothetical protein [Candidatus Micrarchaeota archaeon]
MSDRKLLIDIPFSRVGQIISNLYKAKSALLNRLDDEKIDKAETVVAHKEELKIPRAEFDKYFVVLSHWHEYSCNLNQANALGARIIDGSGKHIGHGKSYEYETDGSIKSIVIEKTNHPHQNLPAESLKLYFDVLRINSEQML